MRPTGNFSSEWGYLAPAPSLMRTVRIVLVATAVGATTGAAVVLSLIERPASQATASLPAHAIVTSVQAATPPVAIAPVASAPVATAPVATPAPVISAPVTSAAKPASTPAQTASAPATGVAPNPTAAMTPPPAVVATPVVATPAAVPPAPDATIPAPTSAPVQSSSAPAVAAPAPASVATTSSDASQPTLPQPAVPASGIVGDTSLEQSIIAPEPTVPPAANKQKHHGQSAKHNPPSFGTMLRHFFAPPAPYHSATR